MEEMSRMKRKQQLTNTHDDVENNIEQEVHPSDDAHFPTREDFHEYKKQRTKKVRNPLFTTLAIIFPIIVIGVFFLLIYYTSEEIKHNNNQDVYQIDHSSSADTDPVQSALDDTEIDDSHDKTDAADEQKKKQEKEKQQAKEIEKQKKKERAAKEKAQRKKEEAAKKREQQRLALQKQQEQKKQKDAEEKKKPIRVVQHTVGPEENLYRISMKYYKNRSGEEKIKAYNDLKGNSVYSGQVLNIPLEN
ncbi:LysM peptidoglycan-binding domain-containing protein [Bacillus pumilus]|nr:LysM peptidoglycan-binding domain-containing protein [Bacillus pumilus]